MHPFFGASTVDEPKRLANGAYDKIVCAQLAAEPKGARAVATFRYHRDLPKVFRRTRHGVGLGQHHLSGCRGDLDEDKACRVERLRVCREEDAGLGDVAAATLNGQRATEDRGKTKHNSKNRILTGQLSTNLWRAVGTKALERHGAGTTEFGAMATMSSRRSRPDSS